MSRRSAIWAAVGLSLGWLGLIGLVALFMPPLAAPVPWITRLFQALAVLLPIGLVGMVVWLLRDPLESPPRTNGFGPSSPGTLST
jgi:preprotein translocase subunit Sss1